MNDDINRIDNPTFTYTRRYIREQLLVCYQPFTDEFKALLSKFSSRKLYEKDANIAWADFEKKWSVAVDLDKSNIEKGLVEIMDTKNKFLAVSDQEGFEVDELFERNELCAYRIRFELEYLPTIDRVHPVNGIY